MQPLLSGCGFAGAPALGPLFHPTVGSVVLGRSRWRPNGERAAPAAACCHLPLAAMTPRLRTESLAPAATGAALARPCLRFCLNPGSWPADSPNGMQRGHGSVVMAALGLARGRAQLGVGRCTPVGSSDGDDVRSVNGCCHWPHVARPLIGGAPRAARPRCVTARWRHARTTGVFGAFFELDYGRAD